MREFDLLNHVYAANARLPSRVTIPPGDDMGALRIGSADVLITVDQVGDGLHFDLATTTLAKIARKAVTRNLSDVAAMAALPVGAVVAACLPRDFGAARATELFDHMRRVAEFYGCPLVGGDISMWDHPLLLSVTVLAQSAGIDPVLRRGARVGDAIFVTGSLGGSMIDVGGRIHHLDFEPRIGVARNLAGNPDTRPNCMIDLSDGLARDLGHLCRAAGVQARVQAQDLPLSPAISAVYDGWPAWEHALGDGEDYELCFTVSADRAPAMPAVVEGCPITRIGEIMPAKGGTPGTRGAAIEVVERDGQSRPVGGLGWEHHGS